MPHYGLGNALRDLGKLAEGTAEFREALRIKPDYAEAHCNLGLVLQRQGRFAEALAELKRGHELGSKTLNWPYPSAQWVRDLERMVELNARLPAVLDGRIKPADAAESIGFAQLCHEKKLYVASARLWIETFLADPKLADDTQAQHRYNAACAAALAGGGQGRNELPPDEAAKVKLRGQALGWLEAERATWARLLASGPPAARPAIAETLRHWQSDPDLAGVRDATALARLAAPERSKWETLWSKVAALRTQAEGRAGT